MSLAPENWPFLPYPESAAKIYPDRYYGFFDAGGVAAGDGLNGYDTAEAALQNLRDEYGYDDPLVDSPLSTNPEMLGSVAVCVLTGRRFVDALYAIIADGPHDVGEGLNDYGCWTPTDGESSDT